MPRTSQRGRNRILNKTWGVAQINSENLPISVDLAVSRDCARREASIRNRSAGTNGIRSRAVRVIVESA